MAIMNKEDLLNPPSTDFSMIDYECAYLPDQAVRMYYKYVTRPNKTFATEVIKRGWRRFGRYYFHPMCRNCDGCKSLRIDVDSFMPTKSQKKAIKRNSNTDVIVQVPTLTNNHIDLYNRYHFFKQDKDGWKHRRIFPKEYFENFVDGAVDFGREVLYFRDQKLIGVDLIDILEDGISSIYCYYDPDYSEYSIGTYSLLYQIQLARNLGLKWIYLGYWVEGCKAFSYKTNYKPQEILDGFPDIKDEPNWTWFTA